MIKRYIAYLKDNPNGYWFKRKIWGYGWTPATWQGWLSVFVWVAVIVCAFRKADATAHSGSDVLIAFAGPFIIATLILIFICYAKGEKPKWRWGFEDVDK